MARLRHRCEDNVEYSAQHKEHVTPMWELLGRVSRINVREARKEAQKRDKPNG